MIHNKILKIAKNVLINAIILILGFIAILAIWASIQLNVQEKEYINIFGYSIFSTATGSMSPTMEKGDIVIVKIGEQAAVKDIITFKKDNAIITHRIIEQSGSSFITQGDNNNAQDEPVMPDEVIGKVVHIVNNVEVWKKVFSDNAVLIPIVITVVLFIILVAYEEKKEENGKSTKKGPTPN